MSKPLVIPATPFARPLCVKSDRFDACWVWTDGSVVPKDALTVLQLGEGDPGLTHVGKGGRGSAWQLTLDDELAVLRHYRRGGMMARVNHDLYVWQGPLQTRSCREFALMLSLANAGLPVPRPIAAMACQVSGLFYRAAILTRYVDHQGALCDCDSPKAWRAAGQAIARLHGAGVWHADLNVHNILIGADEQAWIIDFDRAKDGVTNTTRLQDNLSRLLRSVRKVCPNLEHRLWPVLLDGYGAA